MAFRRSRAVSLLLGVTLFSQLSVLAPNSFALANSRPTKSSAKPATDWSKAMVESTMKRFPTAEDLGSWGYAKSLYLYGQYLVWRRTGDKRYLQYIKDWVDYHVDNEGNVFNTDKDGKVTGIEFTNLDSMLPGNLLLLLYKENREAK